MVASGEKDYEKNPPQSLSRELSWLQFNARVLQEADDPNVPLIERLRFLGIYSSNMDEFYRVRIPALSRFLKTVIYPRSKDAKKNVQQVLDSIHKVTVKQQDKLERIFTDIRIQLEKEGLYFHSEYSTLAPIQAEFLTRYFHEEIGPSLMPLWLKPRQPLPMIGDRSIYFAVKVHIHTAKEPLYALVRIPTHVLPRFIVLPSVDGKMAVMFLDEAIRLHLNEVFRGLNIAEIHAFAVKVTRDSELALEEERDIAHSYAQQVEKSLKKRKHGTVTRLVYDSNMPERLLDRIRQGLGANEEMRLIAGKRYHNFRDFIRFPEVNRPEWFYMPLPALEHPLLKCSKNFFKTIQEQDILLTFPYQRFSYVIEILREAALDPTVHTIKITLYRMADASHVVNALRCAVYNGKRVLAVVELQARFDEENNLYWAKKLQKEGVEVVFGVPGLKVHSKVFLIEKGKGRAAQSFAYIGTGNFNENTAKAYTDCALLTADKRITKEIYNLFEFLQVNYNVGQFKNLMVAPFALRDRIVECIDREIGFARTQRQAHIDIKLNNLNDPFLINKLYEASQAGVHIRVIVRSVCALVPQIKGFSENIRVVSVIDRFLEHSRMLFFYNGGKEKVYLSSADWMVRNLDHRVELACPIYSKDICTRLKEIFDCMWNDTQKSRWIDQQQSNHYRKAENSREDSRGQLSVYELFKKDGEVAL
ncbi:MAG: polyphosphate kinase 1 [Pseudomonadota bacterium]